MKQHRNSSSLISQKQKQGALIGSGALILYGLSRRSKFGTALAIGGGLLAMKAKSAGSSDHFSASASFRVNGSADEAYRLWRDFEKLPRFLAHLESVRVLDERRSEWVARGPMNSLVRWYAEITQDVPGQRIAWQSLAGSEIDNSGSVEFRNDEIRGGSTVTASIQYSLPGSRFAKGLIAALGKDPGFVVREDLRRFKALLETGETPTTVGQTHGPRGIHGRVEETLFRETSNRPQPQRSVRDQSQPTHRATA
jgi:uncharacterized membrane protein